MDEYISPRIRRIGRRAYAATFASAAVVFLSNWADFSVGILFGVLVFLPAFAVAWLLTMYVFFDWTVGSYIRYRRNRRADESLHTDAQYEHGSRALDRPGSADV